MSRVSRPEPHAVRHRGTLTGLNRVPRAGTTAPGVQGPSLHRMEEVVMFRRGLTRIVPMLALATVALAGPAAALDVGEKAPDFSLNAPGGKQVKLSDLLGKGPVVLYTFIGAFNGL